MSIEKEASEDAGTYDFECWSQFHGTGIELRVEDDGEVAWGYIVKPPHETIHLIWLYNVCSARSELTRSQTGALVPPHIEPVDSSGQITQEEDIQCFGEFSPDGSEVWTLIICVKGKMRGLVLEGQRMAYCVDHAVSVGPPFPLPAGVWEKVPQELKSLALLRGCELISFDT